MGIIGMNSKPTRWSYSSISTYENCPRQWYYSYIERLPITENAAMLRGSRLHKLCETYLDHPSVELPYDVRKIKKILEELKAKGAKSEVTWLTNDLWMPVQQNSHAWLKAIIDVHYVEGSVLFLHDFKSGREYPEHRDQLDLYATQGLQMYPEVKRVEYSAIYIDTGHTSNEGALLRGSMADHKRRSWSERAIKLMVDTELRPTPSPSKCSWCAYNRRVGGPCRAGV